MTLVRQSSWLSLGIAANRILPLVVLFVVLRGSAPAEYGQYALAIALVTFATILAEGGATIFASSQADISPSEESVLVSSALRSGLVIFVALLAAAFIFSLRQGFAQLVLLTFATGISVPLAGAAAASIARLQRLGMYRRISACQVSANLLSVLVGLVAAFSGLGVWALALQASTATLLQSSAMLLAAKIRPAPFRKRLNASTRSALRYALAANGLGALGRRSDDVLIGVFLGPAALGLYSLAYRVLTTVTELLLHPAERVTVTSLGSLEVERAEGFRSAERSQRTVAFLGIGVFSFAGISASVAIPLLFSPAWDLAGTCAAVLCLAGAVQSTFNLWFATLYVLAGPASAFQYQFALVLALIIPTIVGVTLGGVLGAAWGYFAGSCLGYCLRQAWRIRTRRYCASPTVV